MSGRAVASAIIMLSLCGSASLAGGQLGTKGQNFDRMVVDAPDGAEMRLTARIMTVNRHSDSASQITIVSNGRTVFGPEAGGTERWSKTVSLKGGGRQEILLLCQAQNAAPVYCGLTLEDGEAHVVE